MEPIAVNRTTVDRALFTEGHAATFSRKRQRMLLYCGLAFLAAGLVLRALQSRLPTAAMLSFPLALSGVLASLWALTLRRSEARRKYKAFRRKNGDASARTITCYPDRLTIQRQGASPMEIKYTDIREHRETEHLLILICKNRSGVLLAKDGFETGSAAELLDAIEQARAEAEAVERAQEV